MDLMANLPDADQIIRDTNVEHVFHPVWHQAENQAKAVKVAIT